MGAKPITAERSQDPIALPFPAQQQVGSATSSPAGLLAVSPACSPCGRKHGPGQRETHTNAGDTSEEFQGIAESRPGAKERGGLGIHWGKLETCVAYGWM